MSFNKLLKVVGMNIDHLSLFVRVAALANISVAGREQGLSAAVASNYINKLEASLGVRLLHRTTRSVSLTEEGQAFLPHATEVLEQIEVAKASVGIGSITPQGKLRVTAPASFGRMHLIPALGDFMNEYPDLDIDLHLSDTIVDVVEGGFDVAIRDAALADSSMIARKLAPDRRFLFASPAYVRQYGEPSTPQALMHHDCVKLMGLEAWSFHTPTGIETLRPPARLRTDNGEAARDASVAGVGITISSTWCSYQQVAQQQLVPVLRDYPLASNTAIWAVYPSSRLLAPKVRVFIDYLAARFGDKPYWDELANFGTED